MSTQFFVTGANGFIGQHMVEYLVQRGCEVHTLIRPGSLPSFLISEHVIVHYGDLRDKTSLMRAMPVGAYVINFAANPYHKTLSHDVNVRGTAQLLNVIKRKKGMLLHVSTQATKILQRGVYGSTKSKSDELVRASGIPFVIIKPSLVYGPGKKGLFTKIANLASKLPFIPVFGDGKVGLYPIHVHDLCTLIEKTITDSSAYGLTFDAGGTQRITYNQLYTSLAHYLPKKPYLIHIPKNLGLLLAKMMAFLPNPPFYEDNILGSTQDTHCTPLPLLKRYNHTPISFQDGLRQIFSPNSIRVGIIGLGKMGMLHATLLRTIPNVDIVALIDTNPKLVTTFTSMGIPGTFFPSLKQALQHKKLDAVYIITPTCVHMELLKEALANKLHVFIEKPVALNDDQIRELRQLHPATIVHTGYTLLYHRPFQEFMRIIHTKRYGKVISFAALFQHSEVLSPKKGWMFTKKLSGGGVLMNPGPHLFSIIHACFGKPKHVTGILKQKYSSEVEDEAHFTFIYPTFEGQVSLSWSVKGKHIADYRITCRCEKAEIIANSTDITIKKAGKTTHIPFEKLSPQEPNLFTINPHAFGEAYYVENLEFIRAIHGIKKHIPNSLQNALYTEDIIQTCYAKGIRA